MPLDSSACKIEMFLANPFRNALTKTRFRVIDYEAF